MKKVVDILFFCEKKKNSFMTCDKQNKNKMISNS